MKFSPEKQNQINILYRMLEKAKSYDEALGQVESIDCIIRREENDAENSTNKSIGSLEGRAYEDKAKLDNFDSTVKDCTRSVIIGGIVTAVVYIAVIVGIFIAYANLCPDIYNAITKGTRVGLEGVDVDAFILPWGMAVIHIIAIIIACLKECFDKENEKTAPLGCGFLFSIVMIVFAGFSQQLGDYKAIYWISSVVEEIPFIAYMLYVMDQSIKCDAKIKEEKEHNKERKKKIDKEVADWKKDMKKELEKEKRRIRKSHANERQAAVEKLNACKKELDEVSLFHVTGYATELIKRVITYMETGRADTVAEALRLDDAINEARIREINRQIEADEARRNLERKFAELKEIEERDARERREREEREARARREHEQRVEDELRRISRGK